MRTWMLAACAAFFLAATGARAAPPAAIFTDPVADAAHPARSEVLHVPDSGVEINALAYIPSGAGPHPTVVLLHGLPGNEKNLDLAQALRRAGWTVVTFNYRGSWGSPGTYSLEGDLVDAQAVLAYVRAPQNAARLQIDPRRLVIMGHSLGGWVTAVTASKDPGLLGVVLISAADMAAVRLASPAQRVALAADNMETLAGVTPQSMADQLGALPASEGFPAVAPGLARAPLLVLTSDDGLAAEADALVEAVRKAGGKQVATVHVATDHSWNTARIRLQSEIIGWLQALPGVN
jgi:pimeloyl-ACP methyl ester carboxylesterase